MYQSYPLQWPVGYARTETPKRNSNFFQTTVATERDALIRELKLLKATDVVLSTNIPLRQDGLPYSDWGRRRINDYGVAVYFKFEGNPSVLCCDAWDLIEDNIHAIVKTVDAMRGIDRWKVSEVLKRTFTGFKALPESTMAEATMWDILGLTSKPHDVGLVHASYKTQAKKLHPDAGGSADAFQELQTAYKQALIHFNNS